jgi:hypothetical protein
VKDAPRADAHEHLSSDLGEPGAVLLPQPAERRAKVESHEDFLALRPVFHWTEDCVRGHVALCILAATIEAVMAKDLVAAKVMDPSLSFQHLTPRRALVELAEIRLAQVNAGERTIELVTRPTQLQATVLRTFGVDISAWDKATVA